MSQPSSTPELSLAHLVQPASARSEGKPPLLIQLHGIGSNERDLFAFAPLLDPRFLVLSVRAPQVVGPDNFAWFEVQFLEQGYIINAEQLRSSFEELVRFIGAATAAYEADPQRVYLIGFSQGASMSLAVSLAHPELVAGACIMSGRLMPEVVPWFAPKEQVQGLPLLVTHGTEDVVIPIRYARQARQALEDLPVSLTYHEYRMGHEVSPSNLEDVRTWLTARLDGPRRVE
ncbi:MAG TPA: alpha/beta fold hydrolase [Ktedonobacterales bacterium]|nr:alpha/beta fold hydrolase [Ktedonobacterales bacterium]